MEFHCSKCKNTVKEGDEYCQKCGNNLVWEKQGSQETIKPETRKEKTKEVSPSQKKFLEQEILKWKENNIISEPQAIRISNEYGIKYQPEEKLKPIPTEPIRKRQPLDVVKVISTIGAIIFGLGVIIFAATNWSKIQNIIRIIILLIATSGILYLGYHFSYKRKNYPILGKALLFTSTLCYGGSLFLIAQIYNVAANSHWLLLIWVFSILPIAFFFSSFPVHILSSLLFISWNVVFYLEFKNLPNYFYILPFIGLSYLAYKKKSITLNIINIVGFFIWAALFMQRLSAVLRFTGFFNWAVLLWVVCMFVFYFIYRKYLYAKQTFFIIANILLAVWTVAFYLDFKHLPNYFYILPFIGLSYLAYNKKSITLSIINIVGFFIWAPLFMHRLSAVLQFTGFFNWAVLLWSVYLFVFYFIYKKNVYTILSSISFILWNITFFVEYRNFPNYFYILPLGVMLYLGYKHKSYANIAINTFGFIIWANLLVGTISETFFRGEFNLIFFLLLQLIIGVLLYILGVYHHNRESIKPLYMFFKIFGYSIILITINIISINSILKEFARESFRLYFFVNIIFIVLTVILIILNLTKRFFVSRSSKYELSFSIFIIFSALFILIKPELLLANTIIFNALLFILAFATILFGFEIKRPAIFNIGIAIFIVFILSRYFYFWGLLPRSIFFMVGGLLLILGGVFLERQRRKTVKQMKK